MTRVALLHCTTYHFDRQVQLSPHIIRLRPAPQCRTPIRHYELDINGDDYRLHWQQDPFGNFNARVVFSEPRDTLSISVRLEADLTPINPFDFFIDNDAAEFPFRYTDLLQQELGPYLDTQSGGPLLAGWLTEWLEQLPKAPTSSVDFLVALNQRVQTAIRYEMRLAPGVQSAEHTLQRGVGSCRDSAWLLVQLLRQLGLAARFVSGYLIQLAEERNAQTPLPGSSTGLKEDFCDLHAWAEVFLPGAGWVGLDATSGFLAGEGHIPLAASSNVESAAAISGTTSPCESRFEVAMHVERLD